MHSYLLWFSLNKCSYFLRGLVDLVSCQYIEHDMVEKKSTTRYVASTNQWIKITIIENNNNRKLSKTFKTLNIFSNPLVPFNKWNYFFFYKIVNGFSLDLLGAQLPWNICLFCVNNIQSFPGYYFPGTQAHTWKCLQRSSSKWKPDHLQVKCDPLCLCKYKMRKAYMHFFSLLLSS